MATRTQPRDSLNLALTPESRRRLLRPINLPKPVSALLMLAVLALVVWSAIGVEASLSRFLHGVPLFINFFVDMWPPNKGQFAEMWPPVRDTLQMAVVGLLLSMIAALPLGLLAAKNTSPHPVLYNAARMLLNMDRAIPSLVWAIIVV